MTRRFWNRRKVRQNSIGWSSEEEHWEADQKKKLEKAKTNNNSVICDTRITADYHVQVLDFCSFFTIRLLSL